MNQMTKISLVFTPDQLDRYNNYNRMIWFTVVMAIVLVINLGRYDSLMTFASIILDGFMFFAARKRRAELLEEVLHSETI